jgi:hypothetical protein
MQLRKMDSSPFAKRKTLLDTGELRRPGYYPCPLLAVDNERADEWETILFDFCVNYVGPIRERAQFAGILFDRNMEPTVSVDGDNWEDTF